MKKITTTIFFLIMMLNACYTQDVYGEAKVHEELLNRLDTARQDTTRVLMMALLANHYKTDLPDSALYYGYKALELARQIKFPKGEVMALQSMILALLGIGNDSRALQMALQGLKVAEKNNLIGDKATLLGLLGSMYSRVENYTKALNLNKESKALLDSVHDLPQSIMRQIAIGETFLMLNQPDSALIYCQSAYENSRQLKEGEDWPLAYVLLNLGKIENKKGNIGSALSYFRQSLSLQWNTDITFKSYFSIAQLYQQMNKQDSCIYYANKSLEAVRETRFYPSIIDAHILLSDIYAKSNPEKALKYSKMAIAYKDSLNNLGRITSFENFIAFDEQERQYEIDTANATYRSQVKQYVLIAGLIVFSLIVYILYRNNRHKQKDKLKIEKAYEKLKSTQSQLIQSEKMASLGELTAGIAHEIQNPLNFVNNFSEVNDELIDEVKQELATGNMEQANKIVDDIKQNLGKINHHGRRADAIVKGMLQHSRTSSGLKEPTDINALADEYLRLAYHGLRAKDKSFNAKLETDFDNNVGKINVVPQEIGRVILNLINNAFYACTELSRSTAPLPPPAGGGFSDSDSNKIPTVCVSTKKDGDKILISVKDNGPGIPNNIIDKIFQPFFTTKPTGQGTGLGLSLAYDIVKAHGGEIKVESQPGEGTEFMIRVPVS